MTASSYQGYCYDYFGTKLLILQYEDHLSVGSHTIDLQTNKCRKCGIRCKHQNNSLVFSDPNSMKIIQYLSCDDFNIVELLS